MSVAPPTEAEAKVLQNVFWLLACEEDCAETAGHDECAETVRNMRRRVEGWFHVNAGDYPEEAAS